MAAYDEMGTETLELNPMAAANIAVRRVKQMKFVSMIIGPCFGQQAQRGK